MGCCPFTFKLPFKLFPSKNQVSDTKTFVNDKGEVQAAYVNTFNKTLQNHEWDYNANCADWSRHYPLAKGKSQSPIDLRSSLAVYDEHMANNPIQLNYDADSFRYAKNNGHTIMITGNSLNASVCGGPIKKPYRFAQFHVHWSSDDYYGSEHLVDGRSFAGEIHFVHWNSDVYKNPKEAMEAKNHEGMLVLAVFLKISEENNPEFEKLIQIIHDIELCDQETEIKDQIDYRNLFPADLASYWCYNGSLTTPPCSECVKWIVFKKPIVLSSSQLNEFRRVYTCTDLSECNEKTRLKSNIRPICKLNERVISKTF